MTTQSIPRQQREFSGDVYDTIPYNQYLSGSKGIISVADVIEMQSIIDSGTVEIGQLFSLVSDRSIRRFEGGYKSKVISDLRQVNPPKYVRLVSVKNSNLSIQVRHDGRDTATGICFSVDGGTPAFISVPAYTSFTLSIAHKSGAPVEVHIWAASSATSGQFGNIVLLNCANNSVTSLDVSGLEYLKAIYCGSNLLTFLDLSNMQALEVLHCQNNDLTYLDVSGMPLLREIYCQGNKLTYLDVSGTVLEKLRCEDNQLTSLDVSGLTALTFLYCHNNKVTSLDVSGLTALTDFRCENNELTSLVGFEVSGPSWGFTPLNLRSNNFDTDSLYKSMITWGPAPVNQFLVNLTNEPCDDVITAGPNLYDGSTYTAEQVGAIVAAKSYQLVVTDGSITG